MAPAEETLEMLRKIEARAGFDLYITSGARCASYNGMKGFSLNSAHTLGLAADISTPDSRKRWLVVEAIYHFGIERVGRKNSDNPGSRFVHFDLAAGLPVPIPREGLTLYPTKVDWEY